MAKSPGSVKVTVPSGREDTPQLGRVGIVAAVGFAIGVAWPWLAGVKLVPSAPSDEEVPAPAAAPSGASATPGSPSAEAPPPPASAAKAVAPPAERAEVGGSIVVWCKDGAGRRLGTCDQVALDGLARPKLEALARCPSAQGASGKLSVGLELDLEKQTVVDVVSGKSTTFSKTATAGLLECAKKEFSGASLEGIDHEHPSYLVYYIVELSPPAAGAGADGAPKLEPAQATEASGLATVRWEVALVRSEPESGTVQARILFGTRVVVVGRSNDWYRIRYDAKNHEGWVHQNALGL